MYINTGKVNILPYSNTSPGHKVKEKVNSNKIGTPEDLNQLIRTNIPVFSVQIKRCWLDGILIFIN